MAIFEKTLNFPQRAAKNLGTFNSHYMDQDAVEVFNYYSSVNAVDIYAYPEITTIQQFCGDFFLKLFHADQNGDFSFHTASGSSEAIFLALLMVKKHHRSKVKDKFSRLNFIVGDNIHMSWRKAANYLDIDLRFVSVDSEQLTLDYKKIIPLIDEWTIGVGATLGVTTTLLFDPIQEINELLMQYYQKTGHFVPICVDAASGGFVAPFFYPDLFWDFRLAHVVAINVSSHKFGFVYPSLGWIILRNLPGTEDLWHENDYLGRSIKRVELQFSHSAAHLLTQYHYFQTLGELGYTHRIKQLFELTEFFKQELGRIEGIELLSTNTVSNLPGVVFSAESKFLLNDLVAKLKGKGWFLPVYKLPVFPDSRMAARIIIRYGFTREHIVELLEDIIAVL